MDFKIPHIPSNFQYYGHQIPRSKCFLSCPPVVFVQSIDSRCRERRSYWSNANKQCSNYIWMINSFIVYKVPLILEVWRQDHIICRTAFSQQRIASENHWWFFFLALHSKVYSPWSISSKHLQGKTFTVNARFMLHMIITYCVVTGCHSGRCT